MASVTNIDDFKKGTFIEFIDHMTQILDLAVDQYDELVIEIEERSQNTRADVEFVFGELHLEDKQHVWTSLSLTIDGIFARYQNKHGDNKDFIKLYELYKSLEVEYEDLFEEYL